MRRLIASIAVVLVAGAAAVSMSGLASGGAPEKRARSATGVEQIRAGSLGPNDRAQALVASDGTVARLRGFVAVSHPGTGEWCLKLPRTIKPGSVVPAVTVDYTTSPNTNVNAQWRSDPVNCPSTRFVEVITFHEVTDELLDFSDQGFGIVIP